MFRRLAILYYPTSLKLLVDSDYGDALEPTTGNAVHCWLLVLWYVDTKRWLAASERWAIQFQSSNSNFGTHAIKIWHARPAPEQYHTLRSENDCRYFDIIESRDDRRLLSAGRPILISRTHFGTRKSTVWCARADPEPPTEIEVREWLSCNCVYNFSRLLA